MRTRNLIVAVVVVLAVFVTAGGVWVRYQRVESQRVGQVTCANYERIEKGMSMEQVEELLGSAGELTECVPQSCDRSELLPGKPGRNVNVVWGEKMYIWANKRHWIHVYIGFTKGRVVSKYCSEASL
jgi:hypothetical protein